MTILVKQIIGDYVNERCGKFLIGESPKEKCLFILQNILNDLNNYNEIEDLKKYIENKIILVKGEE